jgi:hypothetical protein
MKQQQLKLHLLLVNNHLHLILLNKLELLVQIQQTLQEGIKLEMRCIIRRLIAKLQEPINHMDNIIMNKHYLERQILIY